MPPSSGTSLGTATGNVVINAQVTQAAQQITQFSQQTVKQLGGVENALKSLAGAFGIGLGVQGVVQLGKAVVAATELATAYDRQMVAAENLAGSQSELNSLLATYDEATGGVLNKATELANVTKLMSVGFADTTGELEQFATAIRGISIAMGTSADTVTQNLILEMFSQRGQRLDQLGLQYDQIRQRADELQAADSSLTQEMAYQQAVLDQAIERFGKLAKRSEGAKTGLERFGTAWDNLMLAIGEGAQGPVNAFFGAFAQGLENIANWLDIVNGKWQHMMDAARFGHFFGEAFGGEFGMADRLAAGRSVKVQEMGAPSARRRGGGGAATIDQDALTAAQSDYFAKTQDITRQANADILSENQSYLSRRGQMEEQYQDSVAQSASDFAKNRMRAQEDYENSILDIMRAAQQRDARMAEDHARQIERMASDHAKRLGDLQEDLDRSNAQRRADSAERVADLTEKHDEDLADRRADSAQKLLDIEKDYERQRVLALRDHQDNLSDAASRLDANAVFLEQRRFRREQEAAGEAHEEKVKDEQEKLQEAIENLNKAYDTKLADEQESLQKSINQANEAHRRQVDDENESFQQRIDDAETAYAQQLADAKAADAQRIADMAAHFALQKQREDQDQAERMGRMAAHHTEEMTQFDTEHSNRLTQIGAHAADERTALDEEFKKQLTAIGVHYAGQETAQEAHQRKVKLMYDLFLKEQEQAFINSQIRQFTTQLGQEGISPFEIQEFNANIFLLQKALTPLNTEINNLANQLASLTGGTGGTASAQGVGGMAVTIQSGAIQISGVSGQTANDLADIIDQRLLQVFQQAAGFGSGR